MNEVTETAETIEPETTSEIASRPEHVPEKFWDAEKGEIRTEAALKSYGELEKRFGAFKGAPDKYEAILSEELIAEGVSIDESDPILEVAKEFAKSSNMSQEGFAGMLNLYATQKLAESKAQDQALQAEIASLGDDADRRINSMLQWASANMDAELLEGFKDMAVSAPAIKAMEKMVSMTRNAPVMPSNANGAGLSESEVKEMQFAKDANGNRRIQTDPAFRAEFERKLKQVYGEEPHRRIIG